MRSDAERSEATNERGGAIQERRDKRSGPHQGWRGGLEWSRARRGENGEAAARTSLTAVNVGAAESSTRDLLGALMFTRTGCFSADRSGANLGISANSAYM